MDKRVIAVLLLFLVFFIMSDPDKAGPQVRTFVDWIFDGASQLGIFLEGLFSDDPPAPAGG